MKKIFLLVIMLSSSVFALPAARKDPFKDQTLTCIVTSDNKRYEDIFVLEVREKDYSHLSYKRIHLASPKDENGNLTYGELEIVRGCYHGVQVKIDHLPTYLNIECRNDGEEGFITLKPSSDGAAFIGDIYFFMPKIGYPERTELKISCTKNP